MSAEPVLSLEARWKLVNERVRAESRGASDEKKLAQLESLMSSVDDFGWRSQLAAEDDRVRELWMRLRAAWPGG